MSTEDHGTTPRAKWIPTISLRAELAIALLIATVVLLINILVAARTPTVVSDEPPYADPAANLYYGDGFTSTLWAQDRHSPWMGNVPLYQWLLFATFRLVGFGLEQARWLNALLVSVAGLLIWRATSQLAILRTPALRLTCLLLVLSGAVSTLTFRTIRPDVMMFFVCACVFYSCSLQPAALRFTAIVFTSALLPLAGIPMIPYLGLLLFVSLLSFGRGFVPYGVSMSLGLGLGMGSIALLYQRLGSLQEFLGIILPFTLVSGQNAPLAARLSTRIFGHPPHTPENLLTTFFGNPLELVSPATLCDYGALALFALLIFLTICRRTVLDSSARSIVIFAVLVVLVIPPVIHFLGHYRAMYRWMSYMPLCICVPAVAERLLQAGASPWIRRWSWVTFAAAICMGVPLRTLAVVPSWNRRSLVPIEEVAAALVRPSDVVICHCKVYFAVRPRARLLFATGLPARGEFGRVVDLPKNEITLLCLLPEEKDEVVATIGGSWERILPEDQLQQALQGTRYAVEFYRRKIPVP